MAPFLKDPKEIEAFKAFKKNVSDLKQNDGVLLRFLTARDFNLDCAEKMLRNSIEWRRENNMDNCCKVKFPDNYAFELKYKFYGRDYEGSPILWIFGGQWNGKGLLDKGELDNVLKWSYTMMERGLMLTVECQSRGHVVIDLQGLSYAQAAHVGSLKALYHGLSMLEQNYPETIKSVMILNAPWIFAGMFNFFKSVIAQSTLEKLRVFGSRSEWYPELLEIFPLESIVTELR